MSFPFVLELDWSSPWNIALNIVLTTLVFSGIVYAGFGLGYYVAQKKLSKNLFVQSNASNDNGNNPT